jgi:lysophospholipase L1-like esterase
MTTDQPPTVLLFGDSNTHGSCPMGSFADRRRFAPGVRWPGVLRAHLPAGTLVIEEGQPGRTTLHDDPIEGAHRNGLRALPMLLDTHRPIDLVVIMLGTNDMKARFPVTAADIALSVGKLLQTVAASDAGPGGRAPAAFVVCPPPVEESGPLAAIFAGGAAKSARLAPLLAQVARDHGAGFFDAATVIAVSPKDGVHFEAESHAELGQALAPHVAARLSARLR